MVRLEDVHEPIAFPDFSGVSLLKKSSSQVFHVVLKTPVSPIPHLGIGRVSSGFLENVDGIPAIAFGEIVICVRYAHGNKKGHSFMERVYPCPGGLPGREKKFPVGRGSG